MENISIKDPNESKKNKSIKEASLFTWFKFIVGLLFSGLIVYKLAVSDLAFDFSKFDFNILLSLILAIFAIVLSVAFYFKATDTSNLFYDNTYKFTRDISEILGRIEAGFGERLKHLDEGYTGLRDKFDNSGFSEQNIKDTKKEIEKDEGKLKGEIKERDKIIDSLIEKAQLNENDQTEIRKQLKQKEKEISKQKQELNLLKERLRSESDDMEDINLSRFPNSVIRVLGNYIGTPSAVNTIINGDPARLAKYIKSPIGKLPEDDIFRLRKFKIIDSKGDFTTYGVKVMREIVK